MITLKDLYTPQSITLQYVHWYCAYSPNYRNIEEMMAKRGIKIDHSTLNRWVIHYAPKLEEAFHIKNKHQVTGSEWKYYYRVVYMQGYTIDFLLTARHYTKAVLHFFKKAISRNDKPGLIYIDKSRANKAGINQLNVDK